MIRIGKTYGNLMVDVQTGSEKLRIARAASSSSSPASSTTRPTSCCARAHWNVKAAIVMQKTGLTYPQALARLRKAARLRPRRDRRGRRSRGCKELLNASASASRRSAPRAAASSSQHLDVAVQLQERRRQPRRHRSLDHPLARIAPSPRRSPAARSAARAGSSPSPSTAPRAAPRRRRRRTAPRWRAASPAAAARVRARDQRARRLVEADVAVRADAEICRSIPPARAIARS